MLRIDYGQQEKIQKSSKEMIVTLTMVVVIEGV